MDTDRLANIIFDRGHKITQSRYEMICEAIASDTFTIDEYVVDYKLKENFMGKVPFLLNDGSRVLVSEQVVRKLSSLNINRGELESFMRQGYSNFKQVIGMVLNGNN
jgi:hypothetical protein